MGDMRTVANGHHTQLAGASQAAVAPLPLPVPSIPSSAGARHIYTRTEDTMSTRRFHPCPQCGRGCYGKGICRRCQRTHNQRRYRARRAS